MVPAHQHGEGKDHGHWGRGSGHPGKGPGGRARKSPFADSKNACSLFYVVVTWLHLSPIGGAVITITTLSSREFNQGASEAKRAANNGPVFITDRGRPAHVLMSFEEYQRLTKQRRNIADALAMPGIVDIEFVPPRVTIKPRPVDFT